MEQQLEIDSGCSELRKVKQQKSFWFLSLAGVFVLFCFSFVELSARSPNLIPSFTFSFISDAGHVYQHLWRHSGMLKLQTPGRMIQLICIYVLFVSWGATEGREYQYSIPYCYSSHLEQNIAGVVTFQKRATTKVKEMKGIHLRKEQKSQEPL